MAKIIGTVKSISGQANIIIGAKQVHPLKIGEALHENDIIQTLQANAKVVLTLEGGREITLNGNDQILLDESVFAVLEEGEVIDGKSLHQLIADKLGNPEETASGETSTSEANAGAEYASRNDARGSADSSGTSLDNDSNALGVSFNAIQNENFAPEAFDDSDTAVEEGAGNEDQYDAPIVATGNVLDNDTDDLLPNPPADLDVTAVISNDTENPTNFAEGNFIIEGKYGTLVLNGETGEYTYTVYEDDESVNALNIGDSLSESFGYVVSDSGLDDSAILTITINGSNDTPVATAESGNSTEGNETYAAIAATGNVLTNATDVDNAILTVVSVNEQEVSEEGLRIEGTYGLLVINANGSYTYTPYAPNSGYENAANTDALSAGEQQHDIFTYTISDNESGGEKFATGSLDITITGTNDQPVVSNVSETTTETDGTQTFNGQLILIDPDAADSHTFQQIGDATVVASNEVVQVTDFSVVVDPDGAYRVNGNFDALAAGETATVTFTYTATDDSESENATSDEKTVTLTVTGTNDQPVVSDLTVSGNGNGSGVIENIDGNNNITNAYNIDGQFVLGTNPDIQNSETTPHVSINGIGNNATDWYQFSVTNAGDTGVFDIDYGMNYGGSFDPWLNLYDAHGTLIISNDDGGTSPGAGGSVHGYDSFLTYTFANPGTYYIEVSRYPNTTIPNGGTYTLQVSLENAISAEGLLETNGIETIYEGQLVLTSDLDTTDTHTFQQTGTATVVTDSGAVITDLGVTVAENGGYTVNGNFDALAEGETATVTFQYVANDGKGFDGTDGINESSISEPKTVTLTVTGSNDAPVAIDDSGSVIEAGGDSLGKPMKSGNLLSNDTDVDNTDLDVTTVKSNLTDQTGTASGGFLIVNGAYGALAINQADGTYYYTLNNDNQTVNGLNEGETLADTFTYTVSDKQTGNPLTDTAVLTITVTGTNDAPVAIDDIKEADFDTYTVNLGGTYGWSSAIITPTGGNLVYPGNKVGVQGNNPNSNNIDNDEQKESVQFTFTNNVLLNQATVVLSDFNTSILDRDTVEWSVYNGTEFIASGKLTPSSNTSTLLIDTGTQFFNTLNIGTPTDASTSDFLITSVKGYGLVINSDLTVTENQPITIDESYLLSNDSDVDSTILNITDIDPSGTIGVVTMDADGNVTYDPAGRFDHLNAGEIATDTFTYTLSDGNLTDTATVTVNIIGTTSLYDSNTDLNIGSLLLGYDGGDGYDSVTLPNITNLIDVNFEFLSSLLHNIENLNLEGGHKTLTNITPDNVANMTDSDHVLKISGEADDTLQLSGFTLDPNASNNLNGYNVYNGTATGGAEITLHIDQDITNIIP